MARMHAVLKNVAPKLPVYLNDRASSYTSPNSSWYVRWAQADRIAVCPVHHVESGHREVALAVSPEALLNQWGWSGQPSDFANAVATTVGKSRKWNGMVVDCSYLSPSDTLRMLSGIADTK
ncbi:MAG: hypothetical protein H7145_06390 [Akkermansiaceae bacterium]|nr:hypothetical protein [Armatimonadota bacterium]